MSNKDLQRLVNQGIAQGRRTANRSKSKHGKTWSAILGVLGILIAVVFYAYESGWFESKSNEPIAYDGSTAAIGWHAEGDQMFTKDYGFDKLDDTTAKLESLRVAPKDKSVKYDRVGQFGDAWQYDFDHSGCRTRADILQRDMYNYSFKDKKGCEVAEGYLAYDPYTGARDVYADSQFLATKLDVEHIVALEDVCFSGACKWEKDGSVGNPALGIADGAQERREQIANDPLNLIIVDGPQNSSKGGSTFDKWSIPRNAEWRCEEVMRQVDVKSKYNLTVSDSEKSAMTAQIATCKAQA